MDSRRGSGESKLQDSRRSSTVTPSDRRHSSAMDRNVLEESATDGIVEDMKSHQARVSNLISQLDEKDVSTTDTKKLQEGVQGLINNLAETRIEVQGDLSSLLSSFKSGLISAEYLENMIENEKIRSQFIIGESVDIQKNFEILINRFMGVAVKVDISDDETSNEIDTLQTEFNMMLKSLGNFSQLARTPARQVGDVVEKIKITRKRTEDLRQLGSSFRKSSLLPNTGASTVSRQDSYSYISNQPSSQTQSQVHSRKSSVNESVAQSTRDDTVASRLPSERDTMDGEKVVVDVANVANTKSSSSVDHTLPLFR